MVFILKSNNLYKIYTKTTLKNVRMSKVLPFTFMSTDDSSITLPLANLERLSKSIKKENAINNFWLPTTFPCESVLAGNPQSLDRRDLMRHDIIKKWEQKTIEKPKSNSALLLAVTLFAEVQKK